jgi:hypothetical protein
VTGLGVRVKSGWATAVVLAGPARAPRVAERLIIALSDPAVPTSRQPYHAVLRASPRTAAPLERTLRHVVDRATRRSLTRLLRDCRAAGHAVRRMTLVVGSDIDPARIGNDHIRAHALEGRLFRTALEQAARARRLACSVVVERTLYATAAAALKRSEAELRRTVTELGRPVTGPWRSDEKAATLAAWLALRAKTRATGRHPTSR